MTLSRSTPLSRGAGPKRRTRLRPFSDRRASERDKRKEVVAAVLERDGHRCQATAIHPGQPCWGPLDVHEVIPRSAWRDGYLRAENALTVCRRAHEAIGDSPALAHSLGLHGMSWERQGVSAATSLDSEEVERLLAVMNGDMPIRRLLVENGRIEVEADLGTYAMRLLWGLFAETLAEHNAENYIEQTIEVRPKDKPHTEGFVITIQRQGGLTPGQRASQWQARAERAEAALAALAAEEPS